MKVSYKTLLLLLISSPTQLFAQTDSFAFLGNKFDAEWHKNSIKMDASGEISSRSINATMFTDYLIRDEFNAEAKQAFLENKNDRANLIAGNFNQLEYKLSQSWGVYVNYQNRYVLKSGADLTKLIMFGNARYADETVSSSNFSFLRSKSFVIGATHKLLSNDKWKVKLNCGVNSILSLKEYNANELSIFTEESGKHIDVVASNFTYSEVNDNSIEGVGIDLGISIEYAQDSLNTFGFSLTQIAPTFLLNKDYVHIDTSFRFDGFSYEPLKENYSFTDDADSTVNGIINRGRSPQNMTMLPSRLYLFWSRKINNQHKANLGIRAVDFGYYGIRISLSHDYTLTNNLMLRSGVGFGNFSGFQWNESIEYITKKGYHLYGQVKGINALVFPKKSTSYGATAGIAKLF
jgi:Txe/YoeB family toxin of Txe-Axe toxin-antitoxin module